MPPLPSRNIAISADRVIVGEGDGDAAFLKLLCEVRGINGFDFHRANGNTGFKAYLQALHDVAGTKLRSIVIVADNDETPRESFENVRGQIPSGWPHPHNPYEKSHRPNAPHLAIVMLPFPKVGASAHGCLETMLLQAAQATLVDQTDCLNTFCACTGTDGWNMTARDKMRLRCLTSSSFRDDPNARLQDSLIQARGLIPLTHSYFDEMADLLTHLDDWLASPQTRWDDWKAVRAAAQRQAG